MCVLKKTNEKDESKARERDVHIARARVNEIIPKKKEFSSSFAHTHGHGQPYSRSSPNANRCVCVLFINIKIQHYSKFSALLFSSSSFSVLMCSSLVGHSGTYAKQNQF